MTRSRFAIPLLVIAAAWVAARAPVSAQETELARLFPRELVVEAPAGPARLAVPAEVLAAARADLSDVRLFDARGAEVPYLVESAARGAAVPPASIPAPPIGATRRSVGTRVSETFDLAVPPDAGQANGLALTVAAANFVRSVRVVAVPQSPGAAEVVLAEGTIFRFQAPLREQLSLALPAVPVGTRALRVAIEGQAGGFFPGAYAGALEPVFRYEPRGAPSDPPTLAVPLTVRETRRAAGRTELVVALPLGLRADRVRLVTATPNFARTLRVSDAQGDLGTGDVFRVEALRALGGERLEIAIEAPRGDALTVVVEDGDSPPLAGLVVVAVVRQPALVFFADGEPLTLRFGGGRVRAPRYDLAALEPLGLGRALREGEALQEAIAAAARANPRFQAGPALGFLARPGTVLDASRFTHAADIVVGEAGEGIVRVRLPAAAMALVRGDLGDVRVVDADGRQWPYVEAVGLRPGVTLPLVVGPPVRDGRETRYALGLPVRAAHARSLRLDLEARFTERPFTLRGRDDAGREHEILRGALAREPGESGAIERTLGGLRVQDLSLVVEDGDDAPLVVRGATVDAELAEILVAAPPGRYRLLVGAEDAASPAYELARARELVDAVPIVAATVGRLAKNASFRAPGLLERSGWESLALWAALGLAVLVLGGLTLRLARQEGEAQPAAAPSTAGAAEARAASDVAASEPAASDADPSSAPRG